MKIGFKLNRSSDYYYSLPRGFCKEDRTESSYLRMINMSGAEHFGWSCVSPPRDEIKILQVKRRL